MGRQRRGHCGRVRFIAIILCAAVSWPLHADSPQETFADGIAASKRGDYEQAVRHFRNARQQGLDSAALHHNLGVAYYRLGRYDAARASFKRAAETASMRALSHYNLGLVAEAADDADAADAWYRKAYEEAGTKKLRRLAADKLDIQPSPATPYTLYMEMFGGHDSNPRLAEADASAADGDDREGDAVYGALAVGRYLIRGNWSNGVALYGNAYTSRHPELSEEDVDSLTAGAAFYKRTGDWQQRYRLIVNQLRLGGDTLTQSVRGSLRGERFLADDLALELRLRSEYVSGDEGSGYGYLTGWQADTRLQLAGAMDDLRWQVGYEFEYNDRDDLDIGNNFYSVSPSRHEVGVEFDHPLAGRLRGTMDVEYRLSRYPDPEIRNDMDRGEREDDRLSAGIGLVHPVGSHWTGRIEADYLDNNSNFNAFDYERTEVLLSLARTFR